MLLEHFLGISLSVALSASHQGVVGLGRRLLGSPLLPLPRLSPWPSRSVHVASGEWVAGIAKEDLLPAPSHLMPGLWSSLSFFLVWVSAWQG